MSHSTAMVLRAARALVERSHVPPLRAVCAVAPHDPARWSALEALRRAISKRHGRAYLRGHVDLTQWHGAASVTQGKRLAAFDAAIAQEMAAERAPSDTSRK